jgi:hypothetical protein
LVLKVNQVTAVVTAAQVVVRVLVVVHTQTELAQQIKVSMVVSIIVILHMRPAAVVVLVLSERLAVMLDLHLAAVSVCKCYQLFMQVVAVVVLGHQ